MRKKNSYLALIVVLAIAIASLTKPILKPGSAVPEGSQLIIQLQTSPEVPEISDRLIERVIAIIEKRTRCFSRTESKEGLTGASV